jgi:hypothetical protein
MGSPEALFGIRWDRARLPHGLVQAPDTGHHRVIPICSPNAFLSAYGVCFAIQQCIGSANVFLKSAQLGFEEQWHLQVRSSHRGEPGVLLEEADI